METIRDVNTFHGRDRDWRRWEMRRALLTVSLLMAGCRGAARPPPSGVVEVKVTEKGFEPDRVEVPPGKPVTLRFTRTVGPTCADAVDVQGDPVRHMLPLNVAIDVKLTAPASGQLAFACPMNMYRGAIVVVGQ